MSVISKLTSLKPQGLSIAVIGDLMLDRYLLGRCERISPEAPVQVVDITGERRSLGGAGNVAANLRALGANVALAAVVGDDGAGRELDELLREQGIRALLCREARPTTEKTRLLAARQQVVRYDREVRAPITSVIEDRVHATLISAPAPDAVILSDYAKGMLTPALCQRVIAWCRDRGVPVIVDPKGIGWQRYAGATVITPNRSEAAAELAARDGKADDGEHLRTQLGVDHCLITLGEQGMALWSSGGVHRLPTQAREVFDVTGAGDTVVAALALGIAAGWSMRDACELANIAAGIKVGKLGSATVSLAEIAAAGRPTMASKVVTTDALVAEVARRRGKGGRVVFTNGCFDILHRGHVDYLERAAQLGDLLIVGLNTDASVKRLKGPERPVNPQDDRALVLAALASVDFVCLFGEDTPLELITRVQPDVLVKGGDYTVDTIVGADVVKARGGQVIALSLVPDRSTSATLAAIGRL